jgi:glycosyltransferase involved in cell wall biosynthesis
MSGTTLFLSHDASRTGAPVVLLNFLRWLRENRNADFHILTGRSGDLSAEFAAVGEVHSFEPDNALWYRVARRLQLHRNFESSHRVHLRDTYSKKKIGLIYVNSVASARMLDFLSFVDCPVICHVHELDGAIRATGAENIALLEKRRPTYVAVSRAVMRNLVATYGISTNRIQVIHGFVPGDPDGAAGPEDAQTVIFSKLGIPENAKLVCGCGSIEPRKGTDLFLQVAAKVVQAHRIAPVHFVWVGGSPDKVAAMRSQVANSMLRNVVHFVGHTSDTRPYFKASHVFLLTSREDPFPLVVMEAAQCGKPIVCFEQAGGAPEFVEHDAGFVIPDFDVVKMSEKVAELLSSSILRKRMGSAAKHKVVSCYDFDMGAARIAAAIESRMRAIGSESVVGDMVLSQ